MHKEKKSLGEKSRIFKGLSSLVGFKDTTVTFVLLLGESAASLDLSEPLSVLDDHVRQIKY